MLVGTSTYYILNANAPLKGSPTLPHLCFTISHYTIRSGTWFNRPPFKLSQFIFHHRPDPVYSIPMTRVYVWGLILDNTLKEEEEEGIDYGSIPLEQKRHPPHLQGCETLVPSSVLPGSLNQTAKNHTPTEKTPNYHNTDYANFRICVTRILSMATQKATETAFKETSQRMCFWRCV